MMSAIRRRGAFGLATALAGCTRLAGITSSETTGDSTSETTGDGTSETTGDGDFDCQTDPTCHLVVQGSGLLLQDVSEDGAAIAYTSEIGSLFRLPTAGGLPSQLSVESVHGPVAKAMFRGNALAAFADVEIHAGGLETGTMGLVLPGDTQIGPGIYNTRVKSLLASPDNAHLVYSTGDPPNPIQVYLDGALITDGLDDEARARFSPLSDFLVVSEDLGGNTGHARVRAFPLDGGSVITLVPDGCANRFKITPDGSRVVVARNEWVENADLTICPIDAPCEEGTLLVPQAADEGFTFLEDDTTLVFMSPWAGGLLELQTIQIDGTGWRSLGPTGVYDILSVSDDAIVYTTDEGASWQGSWTLRLIRADGTGDIALGASGRVLDFSSDDAFFVYLSDVVPLDPLEPFHPSEPGAGTLQIYDLASEAITTLGNGVTKVAFMNAREVLFLEQGGALWQGELATGTTRLLAEGVNAFDVVPAGPGAKTARGFAFSIPVDLPEGLVAGIYVVDLP